jgi:hypothetical protein
VTGTLSLFNVPAPVPAEAGDATGADDLDDYDDAAHVADPTPPVPHVIVEAAGDSFEVARMRDDGTTVARVTWTRDELTELMGRCRAVLA